jgi:hypothetical protein
MGYGTSVDIDIGLYSGQGRDGDVGKSFRHKDSKVGAKRMSEWQNQS